MVVEKKEVDGRVIQSQPLPEAFPTPEARKEYFNRTYQVGVRVRLDTLGC